MYGKSAALLTQEQKELIANLATLAGMGAGAAVGGSTGAGSGGVAAKVEVENNSLSVIQARSLIEELAKCQTDTECRQSVTEKYAKLNKEQHLSVEQCDSAKECVAKANEMGKLQTEYANRLSELVDKSRAGGLDENESQEWIYLNSVLPTLEMDRDTAIKRALASGESAEAKQLAINSIAQAGAAGIVSGTGKVKNKPESNTNQVITKNI
ncbi:VENN motif pre-toxin domain-containing protein [Pseudomonas graminis]